MNYNEFNTKWKNYLTNTKIDENLLKKASESIDNPKRKAKIEKEANAKKILDNIVCSIKIPKKSAQI